MNSYSAALALLVTLAGAGGVVAGTDVIALDSDGLTAVEELQEGTDPLHPDTDRDGLNDSAELQAGTDPLDPDTDGDGLNDSAEVQVHATDPLHSDSDDDGLTDRAEIEEYGTNPTDADTDADGLSDGAELNDHGTNATDPDSDDDGLDDGAELDAGTDPLDHDTDGDFLRDGEEVTQHGTDPLDVDTDGDGLEDGAEVNRHGSDPTDADTDDDSLDDGAEVHDHGTDPTAADTDGDGLDDDRELALGTDPTAADTDGDGLGDGIEANDEGPLADADPLRMDVFVELDYMEDERPSERAIQQVVEAYSDASIENPDGSTGIALHVVVDEELERQERLESNGLKELRESHGQYRSYGYHYAVAAHDVYNSDEDASGVGNLGWLMFETGWPELSEGSDDYPVDFQAKVFMHELGHSLGLLPSAFGGIDSTIYPYSEYRSAMNYNSDGQDELVYNSGEPFDDWRYIDDELYTPTPYEAEVAS